MRQATKEDLKIGNFVMVNYRNPHPWKDFTRTFSGTQTGYYTYTPIYHKKELIAQVLPIIEIKKLCTHDDNRIDFGSWCHYNALIYLDPNDVEDRVEIERWLLWQKTRAKVIKKFPMPMPCSADQHTDWSYMIDKKAAKKLHKIFNTVESNERF